jgi:hypothetical protein
MDNRNGASAANANLLQCDEKNTAQRRLVQKKQSGDRNVGKESGENSRAGK